jgi:hypothetical protein
VLVTLSGLLVIGGLGALLMFMGWTGGVLGIGSLAALGLDSVPQASLRNL